MINRVISVITSAFDNVFDTDGKKIWISVALLIYIIGLITCFELFAWLGGVAVIFIMIASAMFLFDGS